MNKVVFFRGKNNIIITLADGKLNAYVNGEKIDNNALLQTREWKVIEHVLLSDEPKV